VCYVLLNIIHVCLRLFSHGEKKEKERRERIKIYVRGYLFKNQIKEVLEKPKPDKSSP